MTYLEQSADITCRESQANCQRSSGGRHQTLYEGHSDKEEAAGTVYNASLPFLKVDECERVKGQLSYIVQDMKEEKQQSRSRGFHM